MALGANLMACKTLGGSASKPAAADSAAWSLFECLEQLKPYSQGNALVYRLDGLRYAVLAKNEDFEEVGIFLLTEPDGKTYRVTPRDKSETPFACQDNEAQYCMVHIVPLGTRPEFVTRLALVVGETMGLVHEARSGQTGYPAADLAEEKTPHSLLGEDVRSRLAGLDENFATLALNTSDEYRTGLTGKVDSVRTGCQKALGAADAP